MIERLDTKVEKLPYFSNDELAVILAARRATALPGGEAPPGEASSGDDGDWKMVTGDEPAGRGAGAIRPSWEGPSSGLARTPLPPSPPRLPPTARSATGSNRAKAPPPPPQVEVEEIVEVDSDPYVDPDPAPPPQVGEIMIARQVDGHPEVILRRAPKKARVGEVPNREEVTVQWVEGEFVCVRWRDIEGVARVENLVRRSSNRAPLRTSSAVDPAPPPPPQVGEIMIARQVDGHPDVILRRAPQKERVAKVPNGQEVTVVDNEGEFVLVRWGGIEGFARVENLVPPSSESWPNNAGGHEAWCFRKQGWVKTTGAWYCPVCRFEAEGLGWISERTPEDIENIKTHCWCADRAHAPRICPACQGFNWAWRKACRHCGGATRQ